MHLVVQGREVETIDLKNLAKLSGASRIERIAPEAFRLCGARAAPGITELCERARLDHAFIPPERRLTDFRLLVTDMDSTLITIETIDELADMAGIKPQVAAITARAMRGEIEYDESLQRRVALLAGLDEGALARVYDERLQLSPGAERLLAAAKNLGLRTLLVSGGFTYITDRLKHRLGLDYTCSNTLGVGNGRLTGRIVGRIVNAGGKRDALLRVCRDLGIGRGQVIAIGDGANDLEFMAEAAVSVAYHAKPVVCAKATHAINHVGLDGVLNLFN
ncbi:MAG: phosphoserine phosphatase SerB [Betaproteobacteria bacterium]|nr:phosphoserine phosphatase SerB [Betaproteobacteria bacterium]